MDTRPSRRAGSPVRSTLAWSPQPSRRPRSGYPRRSCTTRALAWLYRALLLSPPMHVAGRNTRAARVGPVAVALISSIVVGVTVFLVMKSKLADLEGDLA